VSDPGTSADDASTGSETGVDPAVAAQEREVERNREQLAGTVDALQAKLDVKSHAKERVRTAKARVTGPDGKPRPVVLVAGAGLVLGVVALAWRRRR
jgi:hypothetical protein